MLCAGSAGGVHECMCVDTREYTRLKVSVIVCMYASTCTYGRMYIRMYVRIYVCMYVCMYVYVCT